ncbi:response regulator [Anoxybacillus geothermalis]|nr:response regulator [Anoxybacillus geothermalis]
MIGSHLPHAEVIAEGANGREAVEIAKQYRPDVMLIDIKMPGLDGLGAIEAIRQFDLDISFIIVSAFDLFDYARQAMRFGVKEYLVKPSRKEDVISALQRVSEEAAAKRQAEEQHRQLAERFHRLQTLVEKEWLSVLMIEDVPADEWKRWEELLPFSVVSGMFLVIQFPAGNRAEEWKRWVEERLSEQTPVRYMTGWMANGRLPVLLFQSDHDAAIAWRPAAQSLALELVSQFALRYNDTLYIGLGSPVLHLHELRSSYYEALSAVHYYAKRQKARVGFLPAEAMRPEREAEQEKQLLEAVRLGDSEQARMLSFAYVDELLSSYSLSAAWRKLENRFAAVAADYGQCHHHYGAHFTQNF